ncbi:MULTISPECIES: hypothetical protein [Dyadobacter]|jgi:hypothetical protein|uniref:Uncharacterized protein n=1 Tax=Dyadobacter chenhuakuii TaxID=2909339 RepID=A0ABY4XL12_9BACT|nr:MULTISPECIES: hypothetical protein [Dyadobacter]MCF2493931.1 hypothetical protein [Dyadobacter chenhuakuii]MCF2518179.1 hypothetical protein [Dyadobacter sp. CY351]USJ31062.1 hypothetical protein NFI80_24795 [Dyadobacter chenhuakuii]
MKKIKPISDENNAVRVKESDENLEKMAKKLTKEWNKPLKTDKVPDLSFSKFEEKLKSKDQ